MFLGALGSDTAGSVRLPAAYCGITGLKQTYGLVSKDGLIPLSSSLDYIGPMARSAADTALMLQAMAGYDETDSTSIDVPPLDFSASIGTSLAGLRVGVERKSHFSGDDVDPALSETFERAVETFEKAGASVREVALPYYREVVDAVLITILGDAMAYHNRLLREQWSAYQRATRMGFASGILFTAGDYVQAQKVRRAARGLVMSMFDDVDIMIMPTTSTAAWPVASDSDIEQIEVARVMASIYTCYWNPIGNPVISVPMGFNASGLPLGLQIAGRPFEDATVIAAADAYQRSTDWHLRIAPIAAALKAGEDVSNA
jgi:aspartyl-tRNA(Asn)/glutamyl-tRNA(Gln) amidotransferase subunit A